MWECVAPSWLCNKCGSQAGLHMRNTWAALNILMPEPPPGDSVPNRGTPGVSQGRELLLGRQELDLFGMPLVYQKFTWVSENVWI